MRELLGSARELEGHLLACRQYPSQIIVFRYHPDAWTRRVADDEDGQPRWRQGRWADCLCVYMTTHENAWLSYLREPGDDGVMLYNPSRDEQPVDIFTRDEGRADEINLAAWHTVGGEEALPIVWEFVTQGRLPDAPEGSWWIDGDEQRLHLPDLWEEQAQAWAEQRRRFQAEVTKLNERASTYAQEFATGQRVCPLCTLPNGVSYHEGSSLEYASFSCDACGRPFAVQDVDRTPQSRVE